MPEPPAPAASASLVAELRRILPTASLRRQRLAGGIELWLLDAEGWDRPLGDAEASAAVETPPYWSFCWGSGIALAEWILARPALVRDRTVLDFGCGSGIVAIAAARAGAQPVFACDQDPHALAATALNASANRVRLRYLQDYAALDRPVDFLFAADVLYDRDNLPLVERFRERAHTVIIADSRIRNFSASGFRAIGASRRSTVPDLGEPEEVALVRFYRAG